MGKTRNKFQYSFALRCGVRYRRFADTSLGPANSNHPVVKAAYWRGIMAALDALYLSETEFCRYVASSGNSEDYADAQVIIRSMRRAVRACRRDIESVRSANEYQSDAKLEFIERELTYLARLGQPPEEVPPYGTRTGLKAGKEDQGIDRNEAGPYNRASDLRGEGQPEPETADQSADEEDAAESED